MVGSKEAGRWVGRKGRRNKGRDRGGRIIGWLVGRLAGWLAGKQAGWLQILDYVSGS